MSAAPYRVRSYDATLNRSANLAYGTAEAAFAAAAELVARGVTASVWCVGDDGQERKVTP